MPSEVSSSEYVFADIASTEPTLADVIRDLWRAKAWLTTGAVFGFLGALAMLWTAVPHYRAAMLVSPTTRTGAPDISSLFPENASYAIEYVLRSFGPGDSSDFMRFEKILREPSVAARLIDDRYVTDGIGRDRPFLFMRAPEINTSEKLAAYLEEHVKVEPVGNTPMRRLSYGHPDSQFAVVLLQKLYHAGDELIRSEMREKSSRRVAWLGQTLKDTQNPEHRRVLASLLSQQEQIRMVLDLDEPYAALVAEPPAAGNRAVWPRKAVVLPFGLLIGMVLAYALYGVRRALRAA